MDVIEDGGKIRVELTKIVAEIGKGIVGNDLPINRVATYHRFISVESSVAEANKALAAITPEPYRVKLGEEEEFVLQMNRIRPSAIENVKLNRIIKWSMERYQLVRLAVPRGGIPPGAAAAAVQQLTRVHEAIAGSVSFDLNNNPVTPPRPPLSLEEQVRLLNEALDDTGKLMQESGLRVKGMANA